MFMCILAQFKETDSGPPAPHTRTRTCTRTHAKQQGRTVPAFRATKCPRRQDPVCGAAAVLGLAREGCWRGPVGRRPVRGARRSSLGTSPLGGGPPRSHQSLAGAWWGPLQQRSRGRVDGPSRQHQETSPCFSGPQLRCVAPTPVDGLLLARREKRCCRVRAGRLCPHRGETRPGGQTQEVASPGSPAAERAPSWVPDAGEDSGACRGRAALMTGRPCSVQRRRCPQADPAGAPAPEALTGLALGPPLLRAAAPQSGLEARVSRLSLLPTLNVRQSILERKSKDRRARGAKHVPVPI